MKQLQLREAKAKLSEVVDTAMAGEPVTITRHGQPVAMVVPFAAGKKMYPANGKRLGELLLEYPGGIDLEEIRARPPIRETEL